MKKLPLHNRLLVLSAIAIIIAAYLSPSLISKTELQHAVETIEQASRPTPTPSSSTTHVLPSQLMTVTRVVDGDTIKVAKNGQEETVRLLGIDTPESVAPRKPVECFGKESSLYLTKLVQGKRVSLEQDSSQSSYDRYGRLLAYVFLEDGTNINKTLIHEGYAFEYTYDTPYIYQEDFKAEEEQARENERGLWSPTACNGKR